MNTSQQIKLGALMSYLGIAINIISGLLYTPWMINSIGKENFGLYTLAMSVITLFVFDFGLSSAVTRYISKFLAEGKEEKAYNFMGLVSRMYVIIDIVLLLALTVLYFFLPEIYKQLTAEEMHKFKIVYAMAAVYSVFSFPFIPLNGILSAYEKFFQLKLCDILHKIIIVVCMTVALLFGGGLFSLVCINVLSGVICVIAKLLCIYKFTGMKVKLKYFEKKEFKEIMSFSGWVTIVSLAQRCMLNLAPSILGVFSGSVSIALFGIAITLEGYTYTFANALNGMFLPKVSRLLVNDRDKILPLMIKVGRIQIYIVGLVVFGFVCFGNEFIKLWMGEGYSQSYYCAVLLIFPSFIHLPQIIGSQLIYASNKVKYTAFVYSLMAIANLGLAAILAPEFGALGVAISICVSYIARTIGLDYIFWRKLDIDIFTFFRKSYAKLTPFLMFFVAISCALNLIQIQSWSFLVIKIFISIICYFLGLYLFAFNQSEKDLFIAPIIRKIHR